MKIVRNALSIGSVLGIPIRLHLSMGIILLLALMSGAAWLSVLIFFIGIFGSVALHELGHSVVARVKGSTIHEIVLYPFGGAAKMSNIPHRPMDEIQVALAGPAVSLALALIFSLFTPFRPLGYINGMLFLFNILPVFPMDGGRVFRAALVAKKGRVEATRIAATTGKYFCWLFVLVGLFGVPLQLAVGGRLFGPIEPLNFLLIFIGFYISRVGQMEYRMVLMEQQGNPYGGGQENLIEVEVSPPPYAHTENGSLADLIRKLFRRR